MTCPRGVCQVCGRLYTGWSLADRTNCECGGKLVVGFPYDVLIGYVRAQKAVQESRQDEGQ